jgi:hypothetical protein
MTTQTGLVMNKKTQNKMIMDAVKSSGLSYKVLNELSGMPQHVRIVGFGDVYPSTGTWKRESGAFNRKDPDGFVDAVLGGGSVKSAIKAKSKTTSSVIKRLNDLEEYCAFLENEINKLKG